MLFQGTIADRFSGALNGTVAARNRGIPYFRARGPIPATWTPSTYQTWVQSGIRDSVSQWKAMSQAFRDAWEVWAKTRSRTNRLGQRHTRTGFNEYVRWSAPRNYANANFGFILSVIDNPPDTIDYQLEHAPTITGLASNDQIYVNFDDTDGWVTDDESALLIYTAAPQPATRNRAYGGYRLLALINGNAGSPPASPYRILALRTSANTGEHLFARFRVTTLHHGMSEAIEARTTVP